MSQHHFLRPIANLAVFWPSPLLQCRLFICKKCRLPKLLYICSSEYSMNLLWKNEKKKLQLHFLFICIFRKCMCTTLMGKSPIEGATNYILKHSRFTTGSQKCTFQKQNFAENCTQLTWNIKMIPCGASTLKYKKSTFFMWLYEGVVLYFTFCSWVVISFTCYY